MRGRPKTGSRLLIMLVLLALVVVAVPSSTYDRVVWAQDAIFNQNQGGNGGYQVGAYDSRAIQPTADNWTRQSRFSAGNDPRIKWEFNISSPICGTPVIGSDGTIYFGAKNGTFYAVDQNGKQKWNYTTGYEIVSSAAIGADGTVYVSSKDGKLYAFNSNGSIKWIFTTDNMIEASPVIAMDGNIYIGCKDGKLIALNAAGQDIWSIIIGGLDEALAIGKDGCIYASSSDGYLHCINPIGSSKWTCKLEFNPSSPAIDKDNNIYVSADKSLYVVNSKGAIRFSYNLNQASEVKNPVAVAADGSIYLGGDMLYRFSEGSINDWNAGIYSCSGLLVGADGNIVVASNYTSGEIYLVNQNGSKIWEYPLGGVEGAPVLSQDGTIYAGSKDGKLYAIDTVGLEVKSCDPLSGSKDVALDKNIKIEFNKVVVKAEAFERIKLTDELVNSISITKTLSGTSLLIDPNNNLQNNHYYTLTIPAEAVKDSIARNLKQDYSMTISTYALKNSEIQGEFTIGLNNYRVLGEQKGMDAVPFVENNRSFIPIRFLAMAIGVPEKGMIWDDSAKSVTLKKDRDVVELTVGSKTIKINDKSSTMDAVPLNRGGRVYLPARYVAEAFGYKVDWSQEKQTLYVIE